jgi:CxxC motif-containing protein (DUF1111 family)
VTETPRGFPASQGEHEAVLRLGIVACPSCASISDLSAMARTEEASDDADGAARAMLGNLGDGIVQSGASGVEMRTAPLWGARVRTSFLHDGRAMTIEAAILAHEGQGQAARDFFADLVDFEQDAILAFIKSL